jgi:hypothetical protein
MRSLCWLVLACAACNSASVSSPSSVPPVSCSADGGAATIAISGNDRDQDGLDDAQEQVWAQQYLPYLSISPDDACATPRGIVVRVSPHPSGMGLLHIHYDVLYNDDCGTFASGITGHIGDSEHFAITVDPTMPPPRGIVAIKAISHHGTQCEMATECGRCAGQTACQTLTKNGVATPAVWAARDKHGNYVNRSMTCLPAAINTCGDVCDDSAAPDMPPIVNVGEPCHPLVNNLTTMGFVTSANGWTHMELFNYDPWGGQNFGGADVLATSLVDPAFDTPACPLIR